ncbi:MAG: histidine kinase [Bacteroidetes bacterium]|nr:histidine kinase [Bacteroidota bacterium]
MEQKHIPLTKSQLFLANFLFWALLCALDILQQYVYSTREANDPSWFHILSYVVPYFVSLWALSFLIYRIFLKTIDWPFKRQILTFLPTGLLFGVVNMLISIPSVMVLMRLKEPAEHTFLKALEINISRMYPMIFSGMLMFWLVMFILFALNFYQKYRNQYNVSLELESRLARSELQTLKMQLQPHFLFNALNTIAMMVRGKKTTQAVEMISGLSDLLRKTLSRQSEQMAPFSDELEILRKYLAIEQVRFKDKLTVQFDIDPQSMEVEVPGLLLQPIVENAFKYGISRSMEDAEIRITSQINGQFLHLTVTNTGPGLPEGWSLYKSKGIGLSNTLARLKQLYHENFRFQIDNMEDKGVWVEIRIPVHINQES